MELCCLEKKSFFSNFFYNPATFRQGETQPKSTC